MNSRGAAMSDNAGDQEKLVMVDKARLRALRENLASATEACRQTPADIPAQLQQQWFLLGSITAVLDELLAEVSS